MEEGEWRGGVGACRVSIGGALLVGYVVDAAGRWLPVRTLPYRSDIGGALDVAFGNPNGRGLLKRSRFFKAPAELGPS